MKALHIIASLDESTGGPARSVPQTCIELAKLGVDIEIICQPSANPVKVPEHPNLKVQFLNYKELYRFGKSLSEQSVDLIHLQHIWTPYISIMAKAVRKANIPYFITPRGMLEPWIMNRNPWKKKLAMALYQNKDIKQANILHATCEEEKQHIQELGYTNKIVVIPNGLDLTQVPEAKTEYGSKKIVFLSRIHPKKGIELLLDAWKNMDTQGWLLEIAGNGEPSYIEQINNLIIKDNIKGVQLVGAKYGDEKWAFLKSANLFILPTYSENFGIVVAEALSIGLPVITTTGTPWKELQTNNCGWWIDLNAKNLSQCIQVAIDTPISTLKAMGENGQNLIRNKYDIKIIAKHLYSIYKTLSNQQ